MRDDVGTPANLPTTEETGSELSNTTIESYHQEQTLTGAGINGIVAVFPQWLVRAIQRENSGGVTMVFPANLAAGGFQCLMSVAISPNKLQRVALSLFNIHLETEGNLRYIIYNDSVRISGPEIKLQGVTEKDIIDYLGFKIHWAVEASPARLEEKSNGLLATNCITLSVASDCYAVGFLHIILGLKEAFEIKEMLYG